MKTDLVANYLGLGKGLGVGVGLLGSDGDGSLPSFFFFPVESSPDNTRGCFGSVTSRPPVLDAADVVLPEPVRPVVRLVSIRLL